jgi:IS5 family transposase
LESGLNLDTASNTEIEGGIISGYHCIRAILATESWSMLLAKAPGFICKAPVEMALDRGYYDSDNEKLAYEAGVKHVCIPKIGRKSKERIEFENFPTFRRFKAMAFKYRRPY